MDPVLMICCCHSVISVVSMLFSLLFSLSLLYRLYLLSVAFISVILSSLLSPLFLPFCCLLYPFCHLCCFHPVLSVISVVLFICCCCSVISVVSILSSLLFWSSLLYIFYPLSVALSLLF